MRVSQRGGSPSRSHKSNALVKRMLMMGVVDGRKPERDGRWFWNIPSGCMKSGLEAGGSDTSIMLVVEPGAGSGRGVRWA